MYDAQTKLSNEVVAELNGFIEAAKGKSLPWSDAKVFNSKIRRNIKLAESPSFGQTILVYEPSSNGAADYRALARELLGVSEASAADLARETKELNAASAASAAARQARRVRRARRAPSRRCRRPRPSAAKAITEPKATPAPSAKGRGGKSARPGRRPRRSRRRRCPPRVARSRAPHRAGGRHGGCPGSAGRRVTDRGGRERQVARPDAYDAHHGQPRPHPSEQHPLRPLADGLHPLLSAKARQRRRRLLPLRGRRRGRRASSAASGWCSGRRRTASSSSTASPTPTATCSSPPRPQGRPRGADRRRAAWT